MTQEELAAIVNTFYYQNTSHVRGLCPKCRKYMILDGYICFGCGYDKTSEEENKKE